MAIQCSLYGTIVPGCQTKKKKTMYKSQMQPTKASAYLIKPSLTIKVFEDQAKEIICSRDDRGEMVREGYDDEGPPFIRHTSQKNYHQRCSEFQIPDYLRQRSLQILEDQN